jgi:hypothetical protein
MKTEAKSEEKFVKFGREASRTQTKTASSPKPASG